MGESGDDGQGPDRRAILRSLGGVSLVGALAGCSVQTGSDGVEVQFGDDAESSLDQDDAGVDDEPDESDGSDGSDDAEEDTETRPSSPPPLAEDCLGHDPEDLTIEDHSDGWLVMANGSQMLLFEERESAERAVELIQAYGLTSICFLNRPSPGMVYWLADGRTPAADDAAVGDEDCLDFDRTNLSVDNSGDHALVVDGSHNLLAFDESFIARQAISIIQHYEFDRMCFVERPDPPMTYFLSTSQ